MKLCVTLQLFAVLTIAHQGTAPAYLRSTVSSSTPSGPLLSTSSGRLRPTLAPGGRRSRSGFIPQWWKELPTTAMSSGDCVCELENVQQPFPHDKLRKVEESASKCIQDVTPDMARELKSLLLGLESRLRHLEVDVSQLEREDGGDLIGAISLQVIENEMTEILQLIYKLNTTTRGHYSISTSTAQKVQFLRREMQVLEVFDTMNVIKREQANQRMRKELDQCKNKPPAPLPTPAHAFCPHGRFLNVSDSKVFTAGEYPRKHTFGAWGRDPKPAPGKESWYWMVQINKQGRWTNYVRRYSSLSSLVVGESIPGNTVIAAISEIYIQGPNVVLYGEALYYGCYNRDAICRFNLETKEATSMELPTGTSFNSMANFCTRDDTCYPYTDLDLATDESGVWVIYTTSQNFGNLVLSKVELDKEELTFGQNWTTSVYKKRVTNTFVACGVLYATRYISKDTEEIFYSLDTTTGAERFNVGIYINKLSPNINSLNYNPVDQMLYVYSDSYMMSYSVVFG